MRHLVACARLAAGLVFASSLSEHSGWGSFPWPRPARVPARSGPTRRPCRPSGRPRSGPSPDRRRCSARRAPFEQPRGSPARGLPLPPTPTIPSALDLLRGRSFGSPSYAPLADITCVAPGGNWSSPATWSGGVPTAADSVSIGSGCTVTIDTAATALSLIIFNGGVLQYEETTARTLAIGDYVTVGVGGIFQSAATGTQTGHVLSVGGSLTNAGTIDFSTNTDTAGAGIVFTGAAKHEPGQLRLARPTAGERRDPEQGHERRLDARLLPRRDDHGAGGQHGGLPDDRERHVPDRRLRNVLEPGLRLRDLHDSRHGRVLARATPNATVVGQIGIAHEQRPAARQQRAPSTSARSARTSWARASARHSSSRAGR